MTAFRVLLVAMWAAIFGYTAIVVANHGMGLLPVFFGDMAKMDWPGQFNLDFMCMLALSALWVAWRHHFSSVFTRRCSCASSSRSAVVGDSGTR